jgi:hypothetical protein
MQDRRTGDNKRKRVLWYKYLQMKILESFNSFDDQKEVRGFQLLQF